MKIRLLASTLALALVTIPAVAAGSKPDKTNDTHKQFQAFRGDKKVAEASYTLTTDKDGIRVKSQVDYLGKHGGSTENVYTIGTDGILNLATIENPGTGVRTIYLPTKTNDALQINSLHYETPLGGRKIPMKPPADFVIAFENDPSVFATILAVTTAHPHDNNVYQLFIPGTSSTEPDRLEPYLLTKTTDAAKGTLDGQPIALTHYTLQFNSGTSDMYTDKDGNLMQAEAAPIKVLFVRAKFVLTK